MDCAPAAKFSQMRVNNRETRSAASGADSEMAMTWALTRARCSGVMIVVADRRVLITRRSNPAVALEEEGCGTMPRMMVK